MQPIYAVGDIHGHLDKLDEALRRITLDGGEDARVIFLGDLVDRGPDSRGVIQRLMDGLAEGRNWTVLLGNHDRMFRDFLREEPRQDLHLKVGMHWLKKNLGGTTTLASYGVKASDQKRLGEVHAAAREAVPAEHMDFLQNLELFREEGACLFVHAGIRPGVALEDQVEDDLVWIRDGFLEHTESFGKLVVHGHTALDYPMHAGNRVNLDGGAGYFRPLQVGVFEGVDCWLLTDAGRVPLRP